MNILVTVALLGLAGYWGWLAAPKVKACLTKLKNKKNENKTNENN